jgi:hypothetical protein
VEGVTNRIPESQPAEVLLAVSGLP